MCASATQEITNMWEYRPLSDTNRYRDMEKTSKIGVLYPAFGQEYILMAVNSCYSLRKAHNTCPVCLVTNVEAANNSEVLREVFDKIIVHEQPNSECLLVKIKSPLTSPYENTLVLDVDTEVFQRVEGAIATLLDRFDFAISLRCTPATTRYDLEGLPDQKWFSHWNTGAFFFKKTIEPESLRKIG